MSTLLADRRPRTTVALRCAGWLLAALLVAAAVPNDAFARAGGGQGYHGSGSGSSHSGGFNSGGESGGGDGIDIGRLIYFVSQFASTRPLIALAVLVLVIYLVTKASQQGGDAYRSSVIRRAGGQAAEQRRVEALERLHAGDARFDEAGFGNRAGQAFVKLQQAWSAQNLAPVQPFVSDGIFERFSLQIAEQRDFRYRNQVDGVQVREVRLMQVAGDAMFDLVTVAIRAWADDYRVSLDNGQRLSEGAERDEFIEYWTFLRRQGVLTGDRPGLIEGQCPNCGAAIELNESARCASCDSLVRSGKFDWVLAEITQSSEWRADEPTEPPSVTAFRQRDPGFCVEHLEDRASVVFWRKAMADRLGDAKPLAKMAIEEFCEAYPQRWGPDKAHRRYWGDVAVGSVDTLGVLPGEPLDRALVEVRWAGRMFAAEAGRMPQPAGDYALFRSLLVLARKPGVTSDVETSLTSAHCPACGAPAGDLTAGACEFCGAVLADGSRDWVLAELLPIPGDEAAALVDQLQQHEAVQAGAEVTGAPTGAGGSPASETPATPSDPGVPQVPRNGELLAWAIDMALADQVLDPRERRALEQAALRRGVPPAQLTAMIDAAQRGQLVAPRPQSQEEGRHWLAAITDMALADGRIAPAEKSLLSQTAQQLGWSQADVEQLIATRKARLYQTAREQLRRRRGGGNNP